MNVHPAEFDGSNRSSASRATQPSATLSKFVLMFDSNAQTKSPFEEPNKMD